MGMQPRSINPMISIHGQGPLGVYCRHCDHLDQSKTKGNSVCKKAHDEIEGPEWKAYRKGGHRLLWATCALFSGETHVTYTCSGPCGLEHTVTRLAFENPKFTGHCKSCGETQAKSKRDVVENKLVLPEFKGCSPVKTSREGNKCSGECSEYYACLDYAARKNWQGFKAAVK